MWTWLATNRIHIPQCAGLFQVCHMGINAVTFHVGKSGIEEELQN